MGPALVGRAAERSALASTVANLAAGRGGLVLVTGPAGIGKTALLDVAMSDASAAGVTVLCGRAWEGGGAPAYLPWTQVVRDLVRLRGPDALWGHETRLAELVPELVEAGPTGPVTPSDGARFALFDAVTSVVRAAAPLLVVLDDLHVAGRPSAALLQFLARELRDEPVGLIAGYRPAEAHLDDALTDVVAGLEAAGTVLDLRGLAGDDIGRLVAETSGFAPDTDLTAAIQERTEGNPLFVAEIARLIATGDTDASDWPIPAGIRQALRARIRRLDERLPAVLGAAAVLGRRFDVGTLARLLDRPAPEVAEVLDPAIAAVLLVAENPGHFRFAHDLVRETAYLDLSPRGRAVLHAGATEVLDGRDEPEHLSQLAHHALAAVPVLDGATAAGHARSAGARAMQACAFDDAARLFEGALAAFESTAHDDGALRCALVLDLAEARLKGGDPPSARVLVHRAAELARRRGDPAALARAALLATERLDFNDTDTDALALLDEAADALDGQPDHTAVEQSRVLARLAVAGYHVLPDDRDGYAERAVATARRSGHPTTLAHALSAQLYTGWGRRPAEDVLPVADEIVALAQRSGDDEQAVDGRMWRLVALLELAELDLAEREVHAVERLAHRLRQPLHRLMATSRRSTVELLRGHPHVALDHARTAREIGERGHEPDADAVYWGQVFVVGQFAELPQQDADRMEAIVRSLAAGSHMPGAHTAGLVLHCLRTGRRDEARGRYDGLVRHHPEDLPGDMLRNWTLAQFALACAAFDDAPTAGRLHDALEPLAGRFAVGAGGVTCAGAIDHYLGLLDTCRGRATEAAEHLERAVDLHRRSGALALLAASRLALARTGAVTAQRRSTLLAEAAAAADELGLTRLAADVATERDAADPDPLPTPHDAVALRRTGPLWTVTGFGRTAQVADSKGMAFLASLIGAHGREIGALELAGASAHDPWSPGRPETDGLRPDSAEPAEPVLDTRALHEYRERLRALRTELEDARTDHDLERADRIDTEIDFLTRELRGALGRGGRRRTLPTAAERARINVTKAIRHAITRITAADDILGAHLTAAVSTGAYCRYAADRAHRNPDVTGTGAPTRSG